MKKRVIIAIWVILLATGCKAKTYTVKLMDDDKLLKSVEVKKGESINKVDKPKKEGYLFVTWLKDGHEYDSNTSVNSDITLTASWVLVPEKIVNHTVTFNYGTELKTQTIEDGKTATKPERDPKKDKHIFLGWYDGDTLYDFATPVTKDFVLIAKFKKDSILITYDLDGGVGQVQAEIDRGTIPSKPEDPLKLGYDFLNWTLDGQRYNFDFPIATNVTIKAVYAPTEYVFVTFDTDGGNTIQNMKVAKGKGIDKLPEAVKAGYTFKYWSYGGQIIDSDSEIDEDITLVAIYEENDSE